MRTPLVAFVLLAASQAFAEDAATTAGQASPSRSQLVDHYAPELADRPLAIGANLFEAGFQGGWQFNSIQGFGEVPNVRYGVTDQFEVTLLGVRYVVAEDSSYIPGLALRAQLHDLAYQTHTGTNLNYPLLRPGGFLELRDRLPFHLTVNGLLGYEFSVQVARAADGTPLADNQRISDSLAPMELELQWSPLARVSLSVRGGYLDDTYTPIYEGVTRSEALLSLAAIYNTSRFDVKLFYTNNWFSDPRLGYVPEVGAAVAVRL